MAKQKVKQIAKKDKKSTWSLFILLFPSLILCMLLGFERTFQGNLIGILIFFFQAVILKNFIENYYKPLEEY